MAVINKHLQQRSSKHKIPSALVRSVKSCCGFFIGIRNDAFLLHAPHLRRDCLSERKKLLLVLIMIIICTYRVSVVRGLLFMGVAQYCIGLMAGIVRKA